MSEFPRPMKTRNFVRRQLEAKKARRKLRLKPCTVSLNRLESVYQDSVLLHQHTKRKRIEFERCEKCCAIRKSEMKNFSYGSNVDKSCVSSNANVDDCDSKASICQIPSEILSEIFRKLSTQDKGRVRLVCKAWYNACNTRSINDRQKMVCPEENRLLPFMKTLENSKLKGLNVEFRHTTFEKCRKTFWTKVGRHIKALQFVDCELNPPIFTFMNENCSQLQHLSWEYWSPYDGYPFDQIFPNNLYPKLISKSPFLNWLTSLTIHVWNVNSIINVAEDTFLLDILRKYRCLRHLSLKLVPGQAGSIVLTFHETLFKELLNSRLETLSFIRGRLALKSDIPNINSLPANYTLRELRFSVWKCESKVQSYFARKFLGLKLLEFCDIYSNQVLQDIWKYQTGLKSIILNWLQCSDNGFGVESSEVSDESELGYQLEASFKSPVYRISSLSKLERMRIILVEKPDRLTEKVLSYFIFPNLRILNISLWTSNVEFTLRFLNHLRNFPNLEELSVYYDKPIPYHHWMKALRNLRKLQDVFFAENHTTGFRDRHYRKFFSKLPCLKRLEHSFMGNHYVVWTREFMQDGPIKRTA